MEVYNVTLFGHRDLIAHREVEDRLYPILRNLICTKQYLEIYIGRNGEFDTFVASVIKRAQKAFGKDKCEMALILPYADKDVEFYEKYYDSVIIPDFLGKVHPKGAIARRNKWMVERCDLFICYVEKKSGGAYKALEYARKLGKKIINLATHERINDIY